MSTPPFGEKMPLPNVVQVAVPVDDVPLSVVADALSQSTWLAPAKTTGAGVKLNSIVSVTWLQPPFPVVVKNINTLPAVVSAALGVYKVVNELLGVNVPVPELDHTPPLAIVTEPFRATVGLLAHTD